MSERQKSKLESFLGDIVEDDLRKLVAAVEFDRLSGTRGLPHNSVLDALRPVLRQGGSYDRVPTPQRMFCTAFEDLLQTLPRSQKQFGRISRTTISPVWDWLSTEAMPEELLQIEEEVTGYILEQDWERAWEIILGVQIKVGGLIQCVVDAAVREPSAFKSLNRHISDNLVLADMRDISNCLQAAPQIRRLQTRFAGPTADLTSRDVAWFEKLYSEVEGQGRLSAYLLLSLMGRMSKPWEILSVIEMMADFSGDHQKYVSDWKFVCDVLLSDLEHVATYFDGLKIEKVRWTELQENLTFFIMVGDAIGSGNDLAQNVDWSERISSASIEVSNELRRVLDRMPSALQNAFDGDQSSEMDRVDMCRSMAQFLELTSEYADRLDLNSPVNLAIRKMYKIVRNLKRKLWRKSKPVEVKSATQQSITLSSWRRSPTT